MGKSKAHSEVYDSLLKDVNSLIALHPATTGTSGRPPGDTGPLLRSSVVLLHTAWENYVEQLALETHEFLLQEIGIDHSKLPHELRSRLGSLKNPWLLAGDSWQSAARDAVGGEVDKLNTPNVGNAEALLEVACGFKAGLHGISWANMSNASVRTKIDEFVEDIRGEIVHKGTTPGSLDKNGVKYWIRFFENVSSRLDSKAGAHLSSVTGASPW